MYWERLNMKYPYDMVCTYYELISKCFPDTDNKQKYIHYTSQESFFAMFKDYVEQIDEETLNIDKPKFVCLFASQMQYLNDKQEYKEGLEIIKNSGVDTSQLFESIFVTCFCGKEDLLSQWKYYGKNCGIAIEFDFNESTRLCWYTEVKDKMPQTPSLIYWANVKPHNVFYKNHGQHFEKIKSIVNNNVFKDTADKEAANIFIPFCKNGNFIEEKESRIVFYPLRSEADKDQYFYTPMEYRVSNGKIIPQFKCKISLADENSKRKIPVKSIMVGPGNNQRLVFNSIINMLERGKENIKFFSDDELDKILKEQTKLMKSNNLGLHNGRITYRTKDKILISMSNIPFRD